MSEKQQVIAFTGGVHIAHPIIDMITYKKNYAEHAPFNLLVETDDSVLGQAQALAASRRVPNNAAVTVFFVGLTVVAMAIFSIRYYQNRVKSKASWRRAKELADAGEGLDPNRAPEVDMSAKRPKFSRQGSVLDTFEGVEKPAGKQSLQPYWNQAMRLSKQTSLGTQLSGGRHMRDRARRLMNVWWKEVFKFKKRECWRTSCVKLPVVSGVYVVQYITQHLYLDVYFNGCF